MNRHKFQWRQELHDQLFHQDIYVLDRQRKLTHLVLHMAKYNGKVFAVEGFQDGADYTYEQAWTVNAVAVDALIVLMSMANTLNLQLPELNIDYHGYALQEKLITAVGVMCKGLEGLDHMEQQDIRSMFHEQILLLTEVWQNLFAETYHTLSLGIASGATTITHDFIERVHARWEQVEAKHIFYTQICKKHPLVAPGHRL